jgi:hypothetical protein
MADSSELKRHQVRFSAHARDDATEIGWSYYEFLQDAAKGQELIEEFYRVAATLQTLPTRHVVQEHESALFGAPVRRLFVRRWHLYYQVEDADDGPLVTVLFLWPATAEPITEDKSQQIRTQS